MKTQHFDPIPNSILNADDPHEAALNTVQAAVDFACKVSHGLPSGYLDQMQHAVDYLRLASLSRHELDYAEHTFDDPAQADGEK